MVSIEDSTRCEKDDGSWMCPVGCEATPDEQAPYCKWSNTNINCNTDTRPTPTRDYRRCEAHYGELEKCCGETGELTDISKICPVYAPVCHGLTQEDDGTCDNIQPTIPPAQAHEFATSREGSPYLAEKIYDGHCSSLVDSQGLQAQMLHIADSMMDGNAITMGDCMEEVVTREQCSSTIFEYDELSHACYCFPAELSLDNCIGIDQNHGATETRALYAVYFATCNQLTEHYDCGDVGNRIASFDEEAGEVSNAVIEHTLGTLVGCQRECEWRAMSENGCCEYQDDHNRCVWLRTGVNRVKDIGNPSRFGTMCSNGHCGPLLQDHDCDERYAEEEITLNSPLTCQLACDAKFQSEGTGCCEYQTDWDRCLFVIPGTLEPKTPTEGTDKIIRYGALCEGGETETRCAALESDHHCGERAGEDETTIGTLEACKYDCNVQFGSGCCEWQADHRRCLWFAGGSKVASNDGGDFGRHALECTEDVGSNRNCEDFQVSFQCGDPDDREEEVDITTEDACQMACEAGNWEGCCEYQIDNKRCLMMAVSQTEALPEGDHGRKAAICGYTKEELETSQAPSSHMWTNFPTISVTPAPEPETPYYQISCGNGVNKDAICRMNKHNAPGYTEDTTLDGYKYRCGVDGFCTTNTCAHAFDGVCQDSSAAPVFDANLAGGKTCEAETDCFDCGRCPTAECLKISSSGNILFEQYSRTQCYASDTDGNQRCRTFSQCKTCENVSDEHKCRGYLAEKIEEQCVSTGKEGKTCSSSAKAIVIALAHNDWDCALLCSRTVECEWWSRNRKTNECFAYGSDCTTFVVDPYFNTGAVEECLAFDKSTTYMECKFPADVEVVATQVGFRSQCEEACVENDCLCYSYKMAGSLNCIYSSSQDFNLVRSSRELFAYQRSMCAVSSNAQYTAFESVPHFNETTQQSREGIFTYAFETSDEQCQHACKDRGLPECKAWTFFDENYWLEQYQNQCYLLHEDYFQELDYTGSDLTTSGVQRCPSMPVPVEDEVLSSSGSKGLIIFILICGVLLIAAGLFYFLKNFKRDIFGFEELEMNDYVPSHGL